MFPYAIWYLNACWAERGAYQPTVLKISGSDTEEDNSEEEEKANHKKKSSKVIILCFP